IVAGYDGRQSAGGRLWSRGTAGRHHRRMGLFLLGSEFLSCANELETPFRIEHGKPTDTGAAVRRIHRNLGMQLAATRTAQPFASARTEDWNSDMTGGFWIYCLAIQRVCSFATSKSFGVDVWLTTGDKAQLLRQ